jgi:hypothetical protein
MVVSLAEYMSSTEYYRNYIQSVVLWGKSYLSMQVIETSIDYSVLRVQDNENKDVVDHTSRSVLSSHKWAMPSNEIA